MAQIAYTPLGDMTRKIQIWDQPNDSTDGTAPDPVIFADGIYAKIEGLWATTAASKLRDQVLAEVSHRITIRYMGGIKPRMFILYPDPDFDVPVNAPAWQQGRRFDIEKPIDPDEMKVELRILAIERT